MTVSALIARYRQADERARLDGGDDSAPCSLDPTRVWSVAEFAEVVAVAEASGEMEILLREVEWEGAGEADVVCPICRACGPRETITHDACCRMEELLLRLDRLDKAKAKGG
jgi:hypothetical protein